MSKYTVIVMLISVLIFNTTLAQDTTLDIRKQAAKDAKEDVNHVFWFALGGCAVGMSCIGSVLVDNAIGEPTYDDGEPNLFPDLNYGCMTGYFLGGITPVPLLSYAIKPTVPPEHLLGKSAAYIETYSETYTKTVRKQRLKNTCLGLGAGTCLTTLYIYSKL